MGKAVREGALRQPPGSPTRGTEAAELEAQHETEVMGNVRYLALSLTLNLIVGHEDGE